MKRLMALTPVIHVGTEYESHGRWSVHGVHRAILPRTAAAEREDSTSAVPDAVPATDMVW